MFGSVRSLRSKFNEILMNNFLELFGSNLISMVPAFVAVLIVIGLVVAGILTWRRKSKRISTRIERFINSEPQSVNFQTKNPIISREITGSLFSRTIASGFNKLLEFIGRFAPEKMVTDTEHKLTIAGNPSELHAVKFFTIRFLVLLAGIVLTIILNRAFSDLGTITMLLSIFTIGVCLFLPVAWLNGQIRTRQDEIRRGLPDALDMLSVCASAGLGFDQSLQKISGYWDNELGLEFRRVTQEMEMGVPRSVALKNMSNRLDVSDLSQFIAIIVQTEKIGMSYANVLASQAIQLRVMRQVRAREIANKLPGKMIIPLVLFIFPAIIAVIIGPTIPVILDLF